jgi:hypothetical protein
MKILRNKNFVALILGPVKHKILEFQVARWDDTALFDFEFARTPRSQDHEGFEVTLTAFRTEFTTHFYDTRHVEYRN